MIVGDVQIPDLKKAKIAEIIASTDYNLLMGGSEELNLLNCLSGIS